MPPKSCKTTSTAPASSSLISKNRSSSTTSNSALSAAQSSSYTSLSSFTSLELSVQNSREEAGPSQMPSSPSGRDEFTAWRNYIYAKDEPNEAYISYAKKAQNISTTPLLQVPKRSQPDLNSTDTKQSTTPQSFQSMIDNMDKAREAEMEAKAKSALSASSNTKT